ncbi:TPA: CsbD family protein [Enterococcus faecalis]|uniref:CsbD family protein n=1 Tax=Enterococcus faecalis TaxID=1351 RepID=UPI003729CC90
MQEINYIGSALSIKDDQRKAEGLLNQSIGKVKEVASDVKDKAEDVVEDVKEKLDK